VTGGGELPPSERKRRLWGFGVAIIEKEQIVRFSVALVAGMLAATPAIATNCGAPDYGSDAASSAAFIKNFSPFFRNTDETAGQFLTRICNAKFGGKGLEGLRALGIPDQDIDSEDVVDLAIDALRRGRDIVNENRGR
jgi:hypothetical protein